MPCVVSQGVDLIVIPLSASGYISSSVRTLDRWTKIDKISVAMGSFHGTETVGALAVVTLGCMGRRMAPTSSVKEYVLPRLHRNLSRRIVKFIICT